VASYLKTNSYIDERVPNAITSPRVIIKAIIISTDMDTTGMEMYLGDVHT